MFIWFVFRDGPPTVRRPARELVQRRREDERDEEALVFGVRSTAKGIVGYAATVPPGKKFSVTVGVPGLAYYNSVGTKLGTIYKLYVGKSIVALEEPLVPLSANGSITVPIDYVPAPGKTYTMTVTVNDKHGHLQTHTFTILTSS